MLFEISKLLRNGMDFSVSVKLMCSEISFQVSSSHFSMPKIEKNPVMRLLDKSNDVRLFSVRQIVRFFPVIIELVYTDSSKFNRLRFGAIGIRIFKPVDSWHSVEFDISWFIFGMTSHGT